MFNGMGEKVELYSLTPQKHTLCYPTSETTKKL